MVLKPKLQAFKIASNINLPTSKYEIYSKLSAQFFSSQCQWLSCSYHYCGI